ncbi:MAG: hypothetical protein J5507_04440 [Clostridia bacterium]|nr:hypothetical protein [Clostridia bacterium]
MENRGVSLAARLKDFFGSLINAKSKKNGMGEKLESAVDAQIQPDKREDLLKELRDSLKRADKIAERLQTTSTNRLSSSIKVEDAELDDKNITVEDVELDDKPKKQRRTGGISR